MMFLSHRTFLAIMLVWIYAAVTIEYDWFLWGMSVMALWALGFIVTKDKND